LTVGKLEKSLVLVAAAVMACSAIPLAADEISDADDLTAVIALQGKPCGRVVNAEKRGENDYVATCQDGNRYRVYVKDGRVIVEKVG
jgi:hypothetical protein